MKRLVKDESLCVGCHNCEEACAMAFTKTADRSKACLRIDDMAKTNEIWCLHDQQKRMCRLLHVHRLLSRTGYVLC